MASLSHPKEVPPLFELLVIAVVVALGVSALCSLLEATLLSLTPAQLAAIGQRQPRTLRIWHGFKQNIEKPIAAILILNTAAHTMGAAMAGAQFEKLYGERWVLLFSLGLTYLILQFSEILPKTLGVIYNAQIAGIIARPLHWLVRVLNPVLAIIHLVNRPFERRRGRYAPEAPAIDQINALLAVARTANAIDPHQARLIHAASVLPQLRIRQIMTPRTELVYLMLDQPLAEVLRVVQQTPYTRLPLCDGSVDRIIGMVHVRDLFNHLKLMPGKLRLSESDREQYFEPARGEPGSAMHVIGSGDIDLRKIARRINIVPAMATVGQVLQQFRESRIHMAIIVDEYGATLGVATLEDVLEEVVGEIEDEFDRPALIRVFPLGGGGYRIDGATALHELRDQIHLVVEDEDVDTLGGLVQKHLGRFPEVGDVVRVGGYELRVDTIDRRRVGHLTAKALPGETEHGDSGTSPIP